MVLADAKNCSGCGACIACCPNKAIILSEDEEGFPIPSVLNEKCIECGLCEKTCPAIHMPETHQAKKAYAAQILDRDALQGSTSGGIFTALSREIFRQGGVVYGCIWDKEYNAVICKAENEEEMKAMRGSKYVWSWAGSSYPEIEAYLRAGRTVLFTGTPCQAAGLRKYIKKDYPNLYIAAFFCGGVPSPYAFHRYLETISKNVPLSGLNLKFRDKEKHGVGVHISYETKRGKTDQSYLQNSYYYAFWTKVFLRLCCYHCQYRYRERVEDITIGDYWGIEKFHKEMDIRSGVSVLTVNSKRGEELLEKAKDQLILVGTKEEYIAAHNTSLSDGKKVFPIPQFREDFFNVLREKGWTSAERRFLYDKKRMKLLIKTEIPTGCFALARKFFRRK